MKEAADELRKYMYPIIMLNYCILIFVSCDKKVYLAVLYVLQWACLYSYFEEKWNLPILFNENSMYSSLSCQLQHNLEKGYIGRL